ncbi:MAG: Ppx/GppA phosphatase family protein [Thermoleophilaceae bacterium]
MPSPANPARIAVLDLGTNSTRLLVAEVRDGVVHEHDRRTEITRLGEGVDAAGRLDEAAMQRVVDALEAFRAPMDELAVEHRVGVATSAVRDADNGDELRARLHEDFGVEVRTISGEEEAKLTFLGATAPRDVAGSDAGRVDAPGDRPTLVVDIGGGSTELVIGRPGGEPSFHVSTRAGSVRQTERHLHDDPPPQEQLAALSLEVRSTIEDAVAVELRRQATDGIAVAGTATSLAAVDQGLEPYDASRVDGYRLELGACEQMLDMLATRTLEERREVSGLHPGRAPTIVAGAAILVETMRAFGLDAVRVSEADLLHGAALEAMRA